MTLLHHVHDLIFPRLLAPIHPNFSISPIDLIGASRLSLIVDWAARGLFAPPPALTQDVSENNTNGHNIIEKANLTSSKGSSERTKTTTTSTTITQRQRAGWLQECFGILVVVFGGETFLAMCTGTTPSWLISPKIALLFCLTHVIQTRTPLRQLLPSKPTLGLELLLSLPDAIGRTLLLIQFGLLPILHPSPNLPSTATLPPTPTTLILVPFILAVPFASLIFSTTNFFSASPKFETPAELKPGGWMMVDFWLPLVLPALFLSLVGPIQGWGVGWGSVVNILGRFGLDFGKVGRFSEKEAMVICLLVCWAVFALKAVYNLGGSRREWVKLLGLGPKRRSSKKIKRS